MSVAFAGLFHRCICKASKVSRAKAVEHAKYGDHHQLMTGTFKALNELWPKQSSLGLRKCHLVGRPRLSQNPYLDSKRLLQEMVERYEEMFAQYHAIRKVFSEEAKTDASLLAKYAEVLLATNFQGDVHSKFLPLYAAIAELSEETDIPALLSRIPLIPKVQ
jgi:hypothetical protein